jgi:glucose/arabinose dehydrogenase
MNRRAIHKLFPILLTTALAACGGGGGGGETAAPTDAAAITTIPVFTALTFERPLAMLQAPADDRRWFIVEQPGQVIAFENITDVDTQSTFIDIRSRVNAVPNEAGLLAMAFHPDFANNGQVFLSYVGPSDGLTSYVSRFTSLDGGVTLDPDSEEVLLSISQTRSNHNNSQIMFGPDGYLYIGIGDGGGSNDPDQNAQNTLNLKGAMLRIDVDGATPYAIPAENPFAVNALEGGLCNFGVGAADCPEIYAWGLRNPWRWSFDSQTGELWAGDVGQRALEEINIIDLGGNYGWPFLEGTRCNTDVPVEDCEFEGLPPVTEYPRTIGRSVTGGYVYRGTAIPDLVGVYVYGDFVTGLVMQYFKEGNADAIEAQFDTDFGISSFGEANNGELYLLDLYGGGIHQIVAEL